MRIAPLDVIQKRFREAEYAALLLIIKLVSILPEPINVDLPTVLQVQNIGKERRGKR
jgi:hypothetical protein